MKELPICPTNWDEVPQIEDLLNKDLDEEYPQWGFDCNFKLDFDGPIIKISSRFYPPLFHYGPGWDGTVHVCFLGKDIVEKKFQCDSLSELKIQVEAYVKDVFEKFKTLDFKKLLE